MQEGWPSLDEQEAVRAGLTADWLGFYDEQGTVRAALTLVQGTG